jgi:heptosyltransferase-3
VASILERLPSGSRLVVIRMRSLGDCVLTTPALALLKAHRPDLRVDVVVEDRFRGVLEGNPEIGALLPPEAGSVRRAELVLNLHGGTRSAWLTAVSGARVRAGFAHHPCSFAYNAKIPRAQEILGEERVVHTAEHIASAMFWLGVPRAEIPRARLFAPPLADAPPAPYALLHPFASAPEKTWPAQRFVAVARHLRESGLEPVVVAGPHDHAAPFSGFRVYRSRDGVTVKSLAARAQLFVGNDSGPAHVAAAFGVPVVVLFGPVNPAHWSPWRTESQVLASRASISEIGVDRVIAAVDALRVRA